ncbi:Spherulation-specific family 4 [Amylocarpus encephaloides]|uniref:Spherulation-specific family 4 n=1 Tax=Amylocarpus encephaloides TaxID=45428 RepID=A0A9P7YMW3_9HELO|nr:Spherulation-specific family 4 [Amylocarpus encephaloides]
MVALLTIFVPIYIFPTAPSTWAPLFSSLAAHPTTNFNIVVNPNSGPGDTILPDASYLNATATLLTYPNAHILGYVPSNFARDSPSQTKALHYIQTYAGWSHSVNAPLNPSAVKVHGIFFDEAPADFTEPDFSFMSNLASAARSHFGYPTRNKSPVVMFNPGRPDTDARFFGLADNVVMWEDSGAAYSDAKIESVPKDIRENATVCMHSFSGDAEKQAGLVGKWNLEGFDSAFVTTGEYNKFSDLWSELVESVALFQSMLISMYCGLWASKTIVIWCS